MWRIMSGSLCGGLCQVEVSLTILKTGNIHHHRRRLPPDTQTKNPSDFQQEIMQKLKHLEAQLASKNDELNIYSQIIGTPREDPAFEMIDANLKIAPLTQQLARVVLHMAPPSNKSATCLTPATTNQKPALAEVDHVTAAATSEGWLPPQYKLQTALYFDFSDLFCPVFLPQWHVLNRLDEIQLIKTIICIECKSEIKRK